MQLPKPSLRTQACLTNIENCFQTITFLLRIFRLEWDAVIVYMKVKVFVTKVRQMLSLNSFQCFVVFQTNDIVKTYVLLLLQIVMEPKRYALLFTSVVVHT